MMLIDGFDVNVEILWGMLA